MTLLTQVQLETQMQANGRERILGMIQGAEERGRADQAPYAQRVFREYVQPLAEIIRQELEHPTAGRGHGHVPLLRDLDPDAVAFLAVRHTLNACLSSPQHHRQLGYALGRTVHRELVLAQIEAEAPELYHTLSRDFARRMSTDERHRLTVFRMQAQKAGIDIAEWSVGSRDQVGLYLLAQMEVIGMVEIGPVMTQPHSYKKEYRSVLLAPALTDLLARVRSHMAETLPSYGPCVEPPVPWESMQGGGFHTETMRRIHHTLVKCTATARSRVRKAVAPIFLSAVNTLQATSWKVNTGLLDVLLALSDARLELAEVTVPADSPKPPRAAWMDEVVKGEELPPDRQAELTTWKRAMSKWYEERKLRSGRFGRFYTATRQALQYKDYPAIYFVYFADSRGRLYPMTYGLNPQGSDLQKALLTFSKGMPLTTDDAVKWFLVQGANKWGFDKATLDERQQWVRERAPQIIAMAEAPLDNRDWAQADNPLQFLAWAMEFKQWVENPRTFLSYLPISMDGSCNGLQHFSAMLRDPIGGEATNLTVSEQMQDIYRRVADAAQARLESGERDDYTARWISHGMQRALVKRSVMTTPYGVTRRSATSYVVSDYLATGAVPEFDQSEYSKAATSVMKAVWPAIGDVVVKAREAMDWLRKSGLAIANEIAYSADPVIEWKTPSGFPATQAYFEAQVHRIRTKLHGAACIRVLSEKDDPDTSRHAAGLAPNFVHSMDAAHLHLVTDRCAREGITDLAMIHDDYGTHAANAERLFQYIRQEFVGMYEQHDPLQDLHNLYPYLPPPPPKGDLDIRQVLRSDFFFS
jgi:DNA-directed RNA polymerase